jgi:hypothetical protein
MQNVSAFGFAVNFIASNTFPAGFTVTAFADDADPMDVPEIAVNNSAMGVNGDLIIWSKANELKPKFAVIDGSVDDINLQILLEANRVGKGKSSAQDVITATCLYPNGTTTTFSQGAIMMGTPTSSVSSAGRIKTKSYEFAFENKTGSGV